MEIDIPGGVGVGVEHADHFALTGVHQIGISTGNVRFTRNVVALRISDVELTGEIPAFPAIATYAATHPGSVGIVVAVGAKNCAGVEAQLFEVRAFE
jgi:hypothetical protein